MRAINIIGDLPGLFVAKIKRETLAVLDVFEA